MDKEYFLEITEETIAYVYFKTERGNVTEFVVKLLSIFDGKPIKKVWYDFLDNSQALTMAITDIKDNFEFYKERYKKWLKSQ